jgi:hypothetical protein
LEPRAELKAWLVGLRARKVRVVLATNSHATYARFVLNATLGRDWREAFDAIFFDCAKPAWFLRSQPLGNPAAVDAAVAPSEAPLPPHGEAPAPLNTPARETMELLVSPNGLPGEEFVGGSAALLDAALRAVSLARAAKAERVTLHLDSSGCVVRATSDSGAFALDLKLADAPQIIFAGDHLHGDVAAAAAPPWHWHAVAVVEELQWDSSAIHLFGETTAPTSFSPREENPHWMGFFGHDNIESHWSQVIKTHAVLAVSDVTALTRIF